MIEAFRQLHRPGDPLVLFNIWDAGSAAAVEQAGARAIATGSQSVAAAHGRSDGEDLSLDLVLENAARIVGRVGVPVSIDFESGYADDPDGVAANAGRLAQVGISGINLEDGTIAADEAGDGLDALYDVETQQARIAAVRKVTPVFINARTDIFLRSPADDHERHFSAALARLEAYAEAGADGFFVPGLQDRRLIARLCEASALPVNIMMAPAGPTRNDLAALGVARTSHGPFPYLEAMQRLTDQARAALG
ncbi:hypothetical protein B5C34_10315 [Pacificimonas flava]|uniref:Phosphonomutase n=2 Tax=Pacificimonas TaxID=1960290 RepID=A0A219B632_9SPHN|nr:MULTISPECIES: isocitrate lyase/phosphoenolpyruvate mutase family protein [Pacificimonas]MBZ6378938.1 isocitrate lyase/phosphoenolpyruvate mutase family protein [Pacificimonas aurantium]OWV33815.1 hypothetical protein B5C34_10315 [Pacificimonas flava]